MSRISVRSSTETSSFYDQLADGKVSRGLWGKDRRFDAAAIARKRSVQRHFVSVVANHIAADDKVLDLGCGPGGFMLAVAPLCRQLVGADITQRFVELANDAFSSNSTTNASAQQIEPGRLPFDDASFDAVLMVDTIHHLEHAEGTMDEVHRVLRPGGKLLIFEPNKYNPALWLMCRMDPNEHGLLLLGTSSKYRDLLGNRYIVLEDVFNGLLIGPESRISLAIADQVSSKKLSPLLGWLSPKLFIAAQKNPDACKR